jgi:alpha-D-ribose 1-methylphosphonate 5-triphosphate synthase subunit PhnI
MSEIRTARGQLNCRIFLVNANRYTSDYLATGKPTDTLIAQLRQKAIAAPPLLLHPPSGAVLFRDGPISVVDLDRLEDQPEAVNKH